MTLHPRYDVFATNLLKGATLQGKYEFPLIAPIHTPSVETVSFDKIRRTGNFKSPLWVHFYVFDTRFRTILTEFNKQAIYLRNYAGIIGMDNSLYRDMPLAEQIHSVYLNRLGDYHWQQNGFSVIPNVTWGDKRSFEFCFDGVPHNSTIAISSLGMMKGKHNLYYFLDGFETMLSTLHPDYIMFHGTLPPQACIMAEKGNVQIHRITCRIQQVFNFR